ncbi:MAG: L,D-transpeptidase [Firmicutes bacterium]|nr:L,D-transpeptidase [Bacillota bacterium]
MNKKKLFSIVLAVMVMMSMSFSSVYALEEMGTPSDEPVLTDDAVTDSEKIEGTGEEDPSVEAEDPAAEDPEEVGSAPIGKLETVSGYKEIKVKWIPNGADNAQYVVEREGNGADWTEIATVTGPADANGYMSYVDNTGLVKETDFSYRVYVKGAKEATLSEVATDQYVRTAHVNITTKVKKTLTCHCSEHTKKATITVKSGTNICTTGYGSGKYRFYKTVNGEEHIFYLMRVAAKNQKTDYTKEWDYSPEEAEFFVSGRFGCTVNDKAHMVWVNEYCQHLYWFDKKYDEANNTYYWACTDNWKISTGKASTPSPTGVKAVVKKISKRHGIKYWTCYSSYNALHGVKSNWGQKLGTPQSSGCIRNATSTSAYKIYKNLLKGQRVYVY